MKVSTRIIRVDTFCISGGVLWVLLYIDVGERWYSYPIKSEKFAQKQRMHSMNIQKAR